MALHHQFIAEACHHRVCQSPESAVHTETKALLIQGESGLGKDCRNDPASIRAQGNCQMACIQFCALSLGGLLWAPWLRFATKVRGLRSRRDLLALWLLYFLSPPILPHPFPEISRENKSSQIITTSTSLHLYATPNGCSSANSPLYLPYQRMEIFSDTDPRPQYHGINLCDSQDRYSVMVSNPAIEINSSPKRRGQRWSNSYFGGIPGFIWMELQGQILPWVTTGLSAIFQNHFGLVPTGICLWQLAVKSCQIIFIDL